MPWAATRRLRDNAPLLLLALFAIVIAGGVALRVRYLQGEMMSRWQMTLIGGKLTTQATVDEWFAERSGDATDLATAIAVRAAGRRDATQYADVLAPVSRGGKFTALWILDSTGAVIASSTGDSLRTSERAAARAALSAGSHRLSSVTRTADDAAFMAIAAPVPRAGLASDAGAPATVVTRLDVVAAFTPWAAGRPNAAQSLFATSSPDGAVLIGACPERTVPVCIEARSSLEPGSPAARALAGVDTFGLFRSSDGVPLLAATGFDSTLGWGVVRRVTYANALVPLHREYVVEGAFLSVLLALVGVGAFAANRELRVRRLGDQRQAADRLAAVVDASTDGIVSLDADFNITMVNASVERLLGYPGTELIGKPASVLFASEWRTTLSESLEALARSSAAHAPVADTERCIALTASGTLVPVDARVGRAELGGATLYVMGLRDVSERARTEHFLQGQRHVLELIAIGAPAAETTAVLLAVIEGEAPSMRSAVYELDDERNVARLVSAPGLTPELARAVDEIPIGPASQAVGTSMHRGESVHSSDVSTDPLWADSATRLWQLGVRAGSATPLRSADGRVIGALACFYDEARFANPRESELTNAAVHLASIALSTARDAASVRASEASFRSFVENAPAAIFRETRSGALVSLNPAMVSLLGFSSAADVIAASHAGLLYHDEQARARLMVALEGRDVVRGYELEWRRADASCVIVRLSARAYRDDRGSVWLWEGYAEDVTSLRAAEGALRRNERLAAMGQLISGVAHELNNPLSSILHFAEDLLQDDRSREDAEALSVIRDQARRSRLIVRDLLSFAKQRQASAEPLSIAEVVSSAARAMRNELSASGVELEIADSSGGALVLADRAGLQQVVTNLVSNAAHAAGAGGHVRVHTNHDDGGCNVVVEDSGLGIPPEILPHIFDPFFTTKPTGEGTGLGLCVTLGIVELFGGRILVDSRGDLPGTRFTVLLPRTEASNVTSLHAGAGDTDPVSPQVARSSAAFVDARTAEGAEAAPPLSSRQTALIIDDEPSIRAALRRYFGRRGWAVEEAADGASGLALLERHGDGIGIVISDLRMPGFSGIELHDRLLRDRPGVLRHVIFSTGDVASAEAASFVQRTRCPVLQKPFELRMLDEVIAAVTGGAAAERVIA